MQERLEITVGDVRLICRAGGAPEAPPLLLLHALGEDAGTWDVVAAQFEASFRVLALDLRGHGESDRPGTYSFELMRDDVLGVLDHLVLERVNLIGHSMGGTVAYLVAHQQPDRIDRLVLEDTPPPFPGDRAVPERPDEPLGFDWAVVPAIFRQLNDPDPVWWDHLVKITAPTLVIAGGPDSHIPQDRLRDAVARLPHGSLQTIAAGHHVHRERPADFTDIVLRFTRT